MAVLLQGLFAFWLLALVAARPVTLVVSAASDLAFALPELAARFTQESGVQVLFNFGSTGQLAQQIERGAPVDLFLAANAAFVERLEAQGLLLPGSQRPYAIGRLVLWTRPDSPLVLAGLADLLKPQVRRVALANPDHAPYGVAAREALQAAGLWEALQDKLILAENVRQAWQYAATGNVDAALIALSLVVSRPGRWWLVPEHLHRPILQVLAIPKAARHVPQAQRLAAFITGPQGQAVLRRYGFGIPAP
ncbi:MAG: molybdate ABC transporter substrate-binding protein [Candidatus Tectimicrobiota bacterium]|nr:MAG: molybdate ABC transporter substrate-binding protein [Candidatus Tectomicrobia bacterium]